MAQESPVKSARSMLLGGAAFAVASLFSPSPVEAQLTVACPMCSSWMTQLAQNAREAQAYATQLQGYALQGRQYTNMIQNTVALPQQVWADVQNNLQRIKALSDTSAILSGNSGNMLARLNSATGYADRVGGVADMPSRLLQWQRSYETAATSFGRTLGLQQGQQADNAALLTRLQAHSQSATGQMQAIQAGNELAAATVNQLMQVQATISASTQYAVQRDIALADRTAVNDAALQAFLGGRAPPTTGYRSW